ncbi:MAG: DUF4465 domain-containing protein [Bacteroidetes bacterium]|nr:DUF4465 domain-containing protein [Bacteroidota bacterium]
MKKKLLVIVALGLFNVLQLNAQTISTFENLSLATDTFWDGSNQSGGFASGNAYFPNFWDTAWGGYWSTGWALSTKYDTTTAPSDFYTQLYSCKEDSAYISKTFAIGTIDAKVKLTGNAIGKVVDGFYITNSTYAFNSMKLGDFLGKKFGGVSGNDPDWFKLVVYKYYQGSLSTNDSVEFYLADFRFSTNSQDYIVDSWTWVDLKSLGNCDSLSFVLSSSDNNIVGMNTPGYFCIDNFTTTDSPLSYSKVEQPVFALYPNPTNGLFTVKGKLKIDQIFVRTVFGKIIFSDSTVSSETIDLTAFDAGVYLVEIISEGKSTIQKMYKF